MTTNSLNNECLNDFDIIRSDSASDVSISISNTSNTASSEAHGDVSVAGSSAGDAYTRISVGTTAQYALGIDNSDSDNFKLTYAASAVTPSTAAVFFQSNGSGSVRLPSTPMFRVVLSSSASNITGDGTFYKVAWDTEDFDVGNNFDATTNNNFVAPIAGKYLFNLNMSIFGITTGNDEMIANIRVNGSATGATYSICNPEASEASVGRVTLVINRMISLAASDTVDTGLTVSGGPKGIDVSTRARFYGFLLG